MHKMHHPPFYCLDISVTLTSVEKATTKIKLSQVKQSHHHTVPVERKKRIQQWFDALCLAKALSSELRLRAVHRLQALNLQAFQAFLLPGPTAEAADSTFSSLHPHSSIPLLPPASCLRPAGPAAVPPRRHSRPPRPCQIGQWQPFLVETRGAAAVREWCRWRLSGGNLKKKMLRTRQEREGMIISGQILKYRVLLCVARWFFYYKPSLQKNKN